MQADTATMTGTKVSVGAREHAREGWSFADDRLTADRVRTAIGPLVAWLDLPHPNVMVCGDEVVLHGDVGCEDDAERLTAAAGQVLGVVDVESHLHIGLGSGDSRPSDGRRTRPPSRAMQRLLAAARRAGRFDRAAGPAVRATVGALLSRLPPREAAHLLSHLPVDVRHLVLRPWQAGRPAARAKHVSEFVHAVSAEAALDAETAEAVVRSVLSELQALVPEEVVDIAAVLPPELREFWSGV